MNYLKLLLLFCCFVVIKCTEYRQVDNNYNNNGNGNSPQCITRTSTITVYRNTMTKTLYQFTNSLTKTSLSVMLETSSPSPGLPTAALTGILIAVALCIIG